MAPVVSIIIPVYNAEKYLRRCIESVLQQDFENFELLLVDDGSTDSSGSICDEYASKDQRLQVIHKENTGVSDTRNLAIDRAQGKYLQFIDSDDWIAPEATGLLVNTAENNSCDMVISDFYRVVGERTAHKGDIDADGVLSREEFAAQMMENPADFYYGVLWNKLYRRDLVEEFGLRMDAQISWCEDFMFNLEYIRHAETFYALHVPIYYYVKRKGSLASQGLSISKSVKMKLMVFEYYNNFYKHVLDEEDYKKNWLQVRYFLMDVAGDGSVPPSILGSHKLGEERGVLAVEAVEKDGILEDLYRNRKLLERCLNSVALKYELTDKEVLVLFYYSHPEPIDDRKKLADFLGVTRGSLTTLLQRLSLKGYLRAEDVREGTDKEKAEKKAEKKSRKEKREKEKKAPRQESVQKTEAPAKKLTVQLLPAAEPILADFENVRQHYREVCFQGFSREEYQSYKVLSDRMKENIRNTLNKDRANKD